MAPRSRARVKIVSPNSGEITVSRSISVHSSRSHTTNASNVSLARGGGGQCGLLSHSNSHNSSPVLRRQPLRAINANRSDVPTEDSSQPCVGTRGSGRVGDQEAIQRVQGVLEAAGRSVLRKPFTTLQSGPHADGGGDQRATAVKEPIKAQHSTPAVDSMHGATNADRKRALQLPPAILGLYRRRSASRSTFADTSRGSSVPHRRPRSASAAAPPSRESSHPRRRLEAPQPADPFLPRSANGPSSQRQGQHPPQPFTPATVNAAADDAAPPPTSHVCPGMFFGLSAIPLSAKLFDSGDAHAPASYYPAPDARTGELAGSAGGDGDRGHDFCPRRCVRPLWSLVGTFKTALTSVVNVDYGNDSLNWQQRSPKGGFQRIRVPLHAVLDAVAVRITQEDEDISERQFTVIVRTSARPSQVVFGFRSTREANEFKNMVRPQSL